MKYPYLLKHQEELYQVLQEMVASGQMPERKEAIQIMETGEPIQIGVESKLVEKVINRPVLQVRDSRNVIIDPSCEGEIENARFIVDKFLTDLSSLRKDSRYSNLDMIQRRIIQVQLMTIPIMII